ncbi:MAG: helix-turn-helix transcriptional regulator [Clostridia bacterium]|nr:helix-turn-helix transcriptional regulator [Clostridia bacterium]
MNWIYENLRDKYMTPVVSKSLQPQARFVEAHLHYNIEALYILDGEMTVRFHNDTGIYHETTIHAGEILICNSGCIHETITGGPFSNYLAFIPPNILPSPLLLPVGKTPACPVSDTTGVIRQLLEQMLHITEQLEHGILPPEIAHIPYVLAKSLPHARLTSLASAILALLYDQLTESLIDISSPHGKADLMKYIYQNYRNPDLTVKTLCTAFGYTEKALSRFFIERTGMGVKQYVNTLRIADAKALLLETEDSVDCIAAQVGCDCTRTFYRIFAAQTGQTPNDFRQAKRRE